MGTRLLSPEAEKRIDLLFLPDRREEVRMLLQDECGNNLPFLENLDATALDRFRFAALKLSGGNLEALKKAIQLAKRDWRDLLVAADFANDIYAHKAWVPERRW
jgi:hypothetical protein